MKNDPIADEDAEFTTDSEKRIAILNLACVIMSRSATPAMKERAELILSDLYVGEEIRPDVFLPNINEGQTKTWFQVAHEACPNWKEI